MKWSDILQLVKANYPPPMRVEKTEAEWKHSLTAEQYRVTRQHGTERAFTGEYCESHSPGIYSCICCNTQLFDSTEQFNSGTGWPSFSEPVKRDVTRYEWDHRYGMNSVEVLCNVCDAHLGHVFPDGPQPGGLRFCINSASLKKQEPMQHNNNTLETATFGGGCFWCTEAIFNELDGIESVLSGYSGGKQANPSYYEVSHGNSGHAEVVQLRFNPNVISYADLLRIFLATHDPTSLNRQGADAGTQYRSIILYHNQEQLTSASSVIEEMQSVFDKKIVTELVPFSAFYEAEQEHKDYYSNNPDKAYCRMVINPKLQKLRANFSTALKVKKIPA